MSDVFVLNRLLMSLVFSVDNTQANFGTRIQGNVLAILDLSTGLVCKIGCIYQSIKFFFELSF